MPRVHKIEDYSDEEFNAFLHDVYDLTPEQLAVLPPEQIEADGVIYELPAFDMIEQAFEGYRYYVPNATIIGQIRELTQ